MGTRGSNLALDWVEQGLVPDRVVRLGIRRLLKERLAEIGDGDAEAAARIGEAFVATLASSALALLTEKANEQHYEVPAGFFVRVLGPHRKYSCCEWSEATATLADAEAAALATTCERAGLADGQRILELGCGWGSLTLWMAERYPRSMVTALSNSHSQRVFIEAEAARRGLKNVRVVTADFNRFASDQRFDRVVSVEMFEHLRNWPEAFRRVAGWLAPGGRFFLHVFVHRSTPYAFVDRDASDWMSRHFFSGGMMPSDDLALRFQDDLRLVRRWRWNGRHYAKTAEAWLANMDASRAALWPLFESTYGAEQAATWWMRWRLFFLSCAELFGYESGECWRVSHCLFEPRPRAEPAAGAGSMSPFERAALAGAAVTGALACATWLASVKQRDASLVDRMWSLMIAAPAIAYGWILEPPWNLRTLGVSALLALWAIRLAAYVTWRNWGHGEDRRYRAIRARNEPGFALKSLALVFLLQAVLAWLVSAPLLAVFTYDRATTALDLAGLAIVLFGIGFEAVADQQLARFKADAANRGKVMDRGLWRITRHPNYFGEFCTWWGFFVMALPLGAWSGVSPLLMSVLLLKVSGVALLEKDIGGRRPEYRDYVRRTSAFFPWPPR